MMDPDQAFHDLFTAVNAKDADAFDQALEALTEWRQQGGFLPSPVRQPQWVHDTRKWLSGVGNQRSIKNDETITITVGQFKELA